MMHKNSTPSVRCTACWKYYAYYNVCTNCSRCFTHCTFVQKVAQFFYPLGIFVSIDLITPQEFNEGIVHKMTQIVEGIPTIDVEFSWKAKDGLIEKQTVRNIHLSDYVDFRKFWVEQMVEQGHIPYAPTFKTKGTLDDKMYIWLNSTGTKILACKDTTCDGKAYYVEGEQKDKKPYQSIRCDKFTDFNSDTEKKRHTNWYNNNEHMLQVDIATNETRIVRGKLVAGTVKVELPERGGNQHDTAKEVYGTDDITGGDVEGMPF